MRHQHLILFIIFSTSFRLFAWDPAAERSPEEQAVYEKNKHKAADVEGSKPSDQTGGERPQGTAEKKPYEKFMDSAKIQPGAQPEELLKKLDEYLKKNPDEGKKLGEQLKDATQDQAKLVKDLLENKGLDDKKFAEKLDEYSKLKEDDPKRKLLEAEANRRLAGLDPSLTKNLNKLSASDKVAAYQGYVKLGLQDEKGKTASDLIGKQKELAAKAVESGEVNKAYRDFFSKMGVDNNFITDAVRKFESEYSERALKNYWNADGKEREIFKTPDGNRNFMADKGYDKFAESYNKAISKGNAEELSKMREKLTGYNLSVIGHFDERLELADARKDGFTFMGKKETASNTTPSGYEGVLGEKVKGTSVQMADFTGSRLEHKTYTHYDSPISNGTKGAGDGSTFRVFSVQGAQGTTSYVYQNDVPETPSPTELLKAARGQVEDKKFVFTVSSASKEGLTLNWGGGGNYWMKVAQGTSTSPGRRAELYQMANPTVSAASPLDCFS